MKVTRQTAISDLRGLKKSAARRFMQNVLDGKMTQGQAERVLASVQYAIDVLQEPDVIKQLHGKK